MKKDRKAGFNLFSLGSLSILTSLLPVSASWAQSLASSSLPQLNEVSEAQAVQKGLPTQAETQKNLNAAALLVVANACASSGGTGNPSSTGSNWWNTSSPVTAASPTPSPIMGPVGLTFVDAVVSPGGAGGPIVASSGNPAPSASATPPPGNCPVPTSNLPWDPTFTGINNDISSVLGTINQAVTLLNNIVNLGQNAWNLIGKGEPKVNFQSASASALPQGVVNWMQMQSCHPVHQDFEAQIPGGGRSPALDFVFRISMEAGCSVNGKGHYIGQVLVPAANVVVGYGNNLSVQVIVSGVTNAGSDTDPVAQAIVQVQYSKSSDFFGPTIDGSLDIQVTGDGKMLNISSDGGSPPEVISPF